jgi:hypothetical protein
MRPLRTVLRHNGYDPNDLSDVGGCAGLAIFYLFLFKIGTQQLNDRT